MDNHTIFEKSEIKWGANSFDGLNQEEQYFIDKYVLKGSKILEAGCGGGRISLWLDRKEIGEIHAFDYVKDFIENAKKNDSNVDFFEADATD